MAITQVTLTGGFKGTGGSAATGAVTFTLSAPITDMAGTVVSTDTITCPLVAGAFSTSLYATDDSTTQPQGTTYLVTFSVNGLVWQRTFALPHATSPVDISALVPATPGAVSYTYALASALVPVAAQATAAQAAAAVNAASIATLGLATKRVTMTVGSDNKTVFGGGVADVVVRIPLVLPVTTTRWRIRIRNIAYAQNPATPGFGAIAGALNLTGVWIGTPVANVFPWAGTFASAPVQAVTATALPSDGSEYTSAWTSASNAQFTADTPAAISIGYNAPAAGGNQSVSCGGGGGVVGPSALPQLMWYTNGAGFAGSTALSSQAGNAAVPTGSLVLNKAGSTLDIRVEYEAVTAQSVGLFIGDSTTMGYMDDSTLFGSWLGAYATWPAQAGLRNRFCWVNAAAGGASASQYGTATDWRYARFDLATTVPGFAVVMFGINESQASVSLATYQANLAAVVAAVRSGLGIPRVYLATTIPEPINLVGTLAAGVSSGVTSFSTSVAYPTGAIIDFDAGTANAETLTTTGASTGTGPYATTTTAVSTKAHAAGATVWRTFETFRLSYNTWVRTMPCGVSGVFDMERALTAPGSTNLPDTATYYGPAGQYHPGAAGYAKMAGAVVIQ